MTVIVDDAGSGDLLFGVVIGVYRPETGDFKYDLIDVRFYQEIFREKAYLQESSRVALKLVAAFDPKADEEIHICQGCIFDVAAEDLRKIYGEDRVKRVHVEGEAQRLIEIAYLDEIRNLGYEPLTEREEQRGKNFFHMMRWLKNNPEMLKYAKTGWPKLKNYQLFKKFHVQTQQHSECNNMQATYKAVCADCGINCEVHFQPETTKPAYCKNCWKKHKLHKHHKPIKRSRKGQKKRQ
jgi:CxxC-x17-CxxC domain-containing protein